jgi:hypothetical protein
LEMGGTMLTRDLQASDGAFEILVRMVWCQTE